jgi:ribonucleotide reductase alpha subunit
MFGKKPSVCLLGFSKDDLKFIKGFDGFIDPMGQFYRVKEIGKEGLSYNDYVKSLMDQKRIDLIKMYNEIKKRNPKINYDYDLRDLLINVLGYVSYEHDNRRGELELICPNPVINNKETTDKQIDTIFQLICLNHEEYKSIPELFKYEREAKEDSKDARIKKNI